MIFARAKRTAHQKSGPTPAQIRRCVRILNSTDIFIGIPADQNARRGDINQAELLFIQEHGVRRVAMRREMDVSMSKGAGYTAAHALYIHEHGSPLWRIPPRPVLEPAIAASRPRLGRMYQAAVKAAWDGTDPTPALRAVGEAAVLACQLWFTDPRNGWPPNAPSTIREKGSSRPLIDTGELRSAITFALRPRGRGQ